MVTVTSGPEGWLLSETRRTSAQTRVPADVRASPLETSAMRRIARDASGKFVSAIPAAENASAPKITKDASAATKIAPPQASARSRDVNSRGKELTVNLGYDPFPKQQQFHKSLAKYRLFGGAAGPKKSNALLMEAILQAHETPGAQTLLLRRTFPELEQSLLYYFRRDVPRELYKSFNESKHVVEWQNGSTTRFGYCQNESDVYQYQGAEFLFIGIDELTLFTLRQWQFLTSRNRCPVAGSFPCMAAATNPGNIGHAWVKALWIDRQAASGMENPDAYDPADYDFIPARVSDNPIYASDDNYLKTLRALPSHLRRAFVDGDWDVFAGQYFDKFDHSRHVARAEQIGWKPWWPRWISIDWGFEHPSAAYWHTATPSVGDVDNPRRVVTYREFVTHRTPPRELARQIVERSLPSGSLTTDTRTPRDFSPVGAQHAVPGAALSGIDHVRNHAGETSGAYGAASPSMFAGHSGAMPLPSQSPLASTPPGKKAAPRPRTTNDPHVIAPIRRRSWHQIYRMLEFESSRRKDQES
jgi:hypothetical protein